MTTSDMNAGAGPAATDKLDSTVWKIASVVVLGSIMAILDVTVVNVALQALMLEFKTSFDTIQWVATGYMLALATVIPVTGWASDRFGTKRLYIAAIAMFLVGSMLAGIAWNIETLIIFRVLQGFGGGMLMPAGMTILTKAAGPQRVGRVMAVLGVPMLLGPIGGPILGGYLVDSVSWRWIFFINAPIGVLGIIIAALFLPKDKPEPTQKFDFPGMLLLSPGLALLIFGVSNIPSEGTVTALNVWLPALLGLVGIGLFIARALRTEHPLVDLTLFRDRTFTMSVVTFAFFAIAFFGAMLLFPSYFLLVRGETALKAGLLLAPQGIGAMLTMPLAGKLVDRIGVGKIVLPGLAFIVAGMAMFTQVSATTPYWQLLVALFVMGLGMGATMMPIMTGALKTLTQAKVARGSTAMNIVQQTAGAIGSAVMSIILAGTLAGKFGVNTHDSQVVATMAIKNPATHDAAATMTADSFATTFVWALILIAVCIIPALFLPRKQVAPPVDTEGPNAGEPAPPVLVH